MFRVQKDGLFTLLAFCLLLTVPIGCESDDPEVPPIPDPEPLPEFTIASSDYLNHRFFKLDLPEIEAPDGRRMRDRIIPESIRIFRMVPQGIPEPGDLINVAAYVDSAGFRKWGEIDFTEPEIFGHVWRRIYVDGLLRDNNGEFIAVDLGDGVSGDDILAVIYDISLADGNYVRVGDRPGFVTPQQEVVGGDGLYYRMKLLKDFAQSPDAHVFKYMLRNIYSLGTREIDQTLFALRIERNSPSARPDLDENGIPYIRIFGLDRGDIYGGDRPDGLADIWNPVLIDLHRGLVRFPLDAPMPFAPGGDPAGRLEEADSIAEALYSANADTAAFVWSDTYLQRNQSWQIYDPGTLPSEYPGYSYFKIIATYPLYLPETPVTW